MTGWIKRIKECLTLDLITRTIAVELIERIEISEVYDKDGKMFLDMNIFYKFGLKNSDCETRKKIEPVESIQQEAFQTNSILDIQYSREY